MRGAFFFDFLAISAWPIIAIVNDSWRPEDVGLIYLLRIFRFSKLVIVMNSQKFTYMVRKRYRKKIL